jgi:septal ring-binding cell division protein DamX
MKNRKKESLRKPRSRAWMFMAILVSAVILATVVRAIVASPTASAQPLSNQAPTADADTSIQFANQKITVDAKTGKLRKPTVEEARALVEQLTGMTNRSTEGLQVAPSANGGHKVDLQGRFQSVILAKPNPDGTSEVRCVSSMEEATEFLGLDPSKLPEKDK